MSLNWQNMTATQLQEPLFLQKLCAIWNENSYDGNQNCMTWLAQAIDHCATYERVGVIKRAIFASVESLFTTRKMFMLGVQPIAVNTKLLSRQQCHYLMYRMSVDYTLRAANDVNYDQEHMRVHLLSRAFILLLLLTVLFVITLCGAIVITKLLSSPRTVDKYAQVDLNKQHIRSALEAGKKYNFLQNIVAHWKFVTKTSLLSSQRHEEKAQSAEKYMLDDDRSLSDDLSLKSLTDSSMTLTNTSRTDLDT